MMLIVWAILFYVGYQSTRLGWKPFAVIAIVSVAGTALKVITTIQARSAMGENSSYLWEPATFASNAAINFVLYAAIYMAGFGIGKLRRRGKVDEA